VYKENLAAVGVKNRLKCTAVVVSDSLD
jgi:hypothetical protein